MRETERCWCGHLKRWHQHGVCSRCARKEAHRPLPAQMPRHEFRTEIPQEEREETARRWHRRVSPADRLAGVEPPGPEDEWDIL